MTGMVKRPRIAVISPFIDKRHGTERCLAEQVEWLAQKYEIHLYSSRVEDIDLSRVVWHRIPELPGPHLLVFCWWFFANHWIRWWHRKFRGLRYDLTYSTGTNCVDADVISVHVLFYEFYGQVKESLAFRHNPFLSWYLLIHRRLYYNLIIRLEKFIYPDRKVRIAAISRRSASSMACFGRSDIAVIHYGVDAKRFNPRNREQTGAERREALGISRDALCLLLIGNGWKNKGLEVLLEALGAVDSRNLRLLIVGKDDPRPYRQALERMGLEQCVSFLPPRPDVEFYYAAADIYVSPSLEDAFGLPPLEAMACGLPVIVSSRAGVSELVTDGVDGLVLADPRDAGALAGMISRLRSDPAFRRTLGENAANTARRHTWEQNARQLDDLFMQSFVQRGRTSPSMVFQEQ